MKAINVEHTRVTTAQQRLFSELAKSGRPNTIYEHTRIAVEALVNAGAPLDVARGVVAESLSSLRNMGVRAPLNIPWNPKK